jgi:carboxylate-amine ligase
VTLHLFERFGVELEYMLVDRETLDVCPVADEVLRRAAGSSAWVADLEREPVDWSNELVQHVLELKTHGPAADLAELPKQFQEAVGEAEAIASEFGACLLPTAMHPWMDPLRETHLWPHEASPIYKAFDRIFGCSGHGWSNLQSVHLNLPFADDEEFGHLHAAIRVILPLLPALAASSPFVEGRSTGLLDNRMEFYRHNARRFPSVAGSIVPEPIFSRAAYESVVLRRIYDDLAPHDPEGVLRHEFANARGAIPRFGRGSIEIRVIDMQECPLADLAIVAATVAAVRQLANERWAPLRELQAAETERLKALFLDGIRDGNATMLEDRAYLRLFGMESSRATAGQVWGALIESAIADGLLIEEPWRRPLERILRHGCLARRLVVAVGESPTRERLHAVYERLVACLHAGEMFD